VGHVGGGRVQVVAGGGARRVVRVGTHVWTE
jgi:hypothetical protein